MAGISPSLSDILSLYFFQYKGMSDPIVVQNFSSNMWRDSICWYNNINNQLDAYRQRLRCFIPQTVNTV